MKVLKLITSVKTRIATIVRAIPPGMRKQWNFCILYAGMLPIADLVSAYWMYLIVMAMQNRTINLGGYIIHSPQHSNFALLIVGFILLSIIRQLISFASVSTSRKFTQNIYKNYSVKLIRSYLSMPWLNFTGDTRSSKIKHCTHTTLDAAFSFQVVLNFISSLLTLVLLGSATFIKVPILAVSALISLLIVSTIIKKKIAIKMRDAVAAQQIHQKEYHQKLHEIFNLPREINLFGVKNHFLNNLEELLKKLSKANTDLSIYPQIPKIAIELVLTISLTMGIVITLLSGAYSSAELIANTATVALLARRIIPSMSDFLSAYTELYGAMMNIEDIQNELTEEYPSSEISASENMPSTALLKLEDIAFAYSGKDRILENTCLDVHENDRIMLHGKTGKGKSTLLMVAAGIIRPSAGKVFINKSITGNYPFAYVAQETVLMKGSVLDNIVFGSPSIDRNRANEVVKLVNLDTHINSLIHKLDTEIGDNGVSFSGGQRQRLGIARALYNKPNVLFLDEATSALDEETEIIVMQNINEFMQEGAVLFITHRTAIGEKFANKKCYL